MYLPLFLIMLEKFESAFVELSSQVFNLLQIRASLILRQRIRTRNIGRQVCLVVERLGIGLVLAKAD